MRLVPLAVAGLLLTAAPVSAQYYAAPRPPAAIGPELLDSAAEIVAAMGLEPVGPAIRSGAFLIQRAMDDYGRLLRVTVDARRSQVMAVEPAGAPRGPYAVYAPYGPDTAYRPYGEPFYREPGYREPNPRLGREDNIAPPGSVMGWHEPRGALPQPRAAAITPDLPVPPTPAKPRAKSAAVTPPATMPQHLQAAPTPRKRPAAAPQEAAGSIEPVTPQGAAAQSPAPPVSPATPPAAAPNKPDNAMPPIAPLE